MVAPEARVSAVTRQSYGGAKTKNLVEEGGLERRN